MKRLGLVLSLPCLILAGRAEQIGVSLDGTHLIWRESGKPAFLVSTTVKWESFGEEAMCIPWEKAKKRFGGYAWLYNQPNTIAKLTRMGFNSLNAFALPTGYLPLLPDYAPAKTPEGEFDELLRLERQYGWYDPGRKVDALGHSHSQSQWAAAMAEMRALTDMPFYVDFHTPRPYRLSAARAVVGNKLDIGSLFYAKRGSAFTQAFRLSSAAGRDALVKMYVHDAQMYKRLGVKPWAYKLLNEPSYYDTSRPTQALAPKGLTGRALEVEQLKVRERLMSDICQRLRRELQAVEPGTPTFAQVHSQAWKQSWNSIDLYSLDRAMDIISIGTGGYAYGHVEVAPHGVAFDKAAEPGSDLTDHLGKMAFYRALARGKPLVASEMYFGGMGKDRAADVEKTLAHAAAEGVSMANLWEWGPLYYGVPHVSYVLTNPLGCLPQTWDKFPDVVKRLNALTDFFPAGVRRERTRVACLFSNPTRRFAPNRTVGFEQAVAALELAHVRTDAIFEEQLPEGPDCRLGDYDVIVACGVDETLETTDAALRGWLDRGGTLVVFDAPMDCNEYGEKREKPLVRSCHRNLVKLPDEQASFVRSLQLREVLAKRGIAPVADVRDVVTGDLAPYVRVVRAANGEGLTGWMFANYSGTARLVSVKAPAVGPFAVEPFGTNAWPTAAGEMQVLVPAQGFAYAICGERAKLEARFGAKMQLSAADARAALERMEAADAARAPRRKSAPISLTAYANGGFDNQQGWKTDTVWRDGRGTGLWGVPYHGQTYRHIDFDVIRFDFNENRTTVALKSKRRPDGLARTGAIPLGGRQLRGLAMLLAAVHARPGETACALEVRFVDGQTVRQPLRVGTELGDWSIADNPEELQKRCVWKNGSGKGFFLYEWDNPRPSDPVESLTLVGGEGESAANVLAVTALPTIFTQRYARRIDLEKGPFVEGLVKSRGRTFAPAAGKPWPLTAEEIPKVVLRFQMAQPPGKFGETPVFIHADTSLTGKLKSGETTRTDAHSITEAGNLVRACFQRSVVTADEWAEIELPLWRVCTGEDSAGAIKPMVTLESVTVNYWSPAHWFRNVRLEW